MKIAEIYVDGFKNIVDTRLKLNFSRYNKRFSFHPF